MRVQTGQRVEVCNDSGTVIPLYTQGIVVETDTKRSRYGYHVEVEWDLMLGGQNRRTWVMLGNIKVIAEAQASAA